MNEQSMINSIKWYKKTGKIKVSNLKRYDKGTHKELPTLNYIPSAPPTFCGVTYVLPTKLFNLLNCDCFLETCCKGIQN